MLSANPIDYAGRTNEDLLLFDNASIVGDARLTPALALPGQSGALIAGIELLVQRFLLELLTDVGSIKYLPTRGCTFLMDARRGMWRTPADIESSFSAALLDVRNNLQADEEDTDPLDERFKNAVLTKTALSGDYAAITIELTSMAETSRTIVYPLRVSNL